MFIIGYSLMATVNKPTLYLLMYPTKEAFNKVDILYARGNGLAIREDGKVTSERGIYPYVNHYITITEKQFNQFVTVKKLSSVREALLNLKESVNVNRTVP